jgi:hypothetical protein
MNTPAFRSQALCLPSPFKALVAAASKIATIKPCAAMMETDKLTQDLSSGFPIQQAHPKSQSAKCAAALSLGLSSMDDTYRTAYNTR